MKAVVIVEPEIPENTGFIARLAANFDYKLRIVNPDFNLEQARETASNAQEKLREARIFDSVQKAVKDLDFVVGTKPGRGQELQSLKPRKNTSIMLGRESNGLSNDELELCDATVYIETGEYESINQSHAASILMYSMNSREEKEGLSKGQKRKIKELAPESVAEALIKLNPDNRKAGRLLEELRRLTESD